MLQVHRSNGACVKVKGLRRDRVVGVVRAVSCWEHSLQSKKGKRTPSWISAPAEPQLQQHWKSKSPENALQSKTDESFFLNLVTGKTQLSK